MTLQEFIENRLKELLKYYVDDRLVSFKLLDKREWADDLRLVYYLETDKSKFVIKLFRNDFTDYERIEKWSELMISYKACGYLVPEIILTKQKTKSLKWMDQTGAFFVVWLETYLEIPPFEEELLFQKLYLKSLGHMLGRMSLSQSSILTPTPYVLFDKFCKKDPWDEYTEFIEKTYTLLKGDRSVDQLILDYVYHQFYALRSKLKLKYDQLPRAVYQADLNKTNLIVHKGEIKGLVDFNISGREVVLNYLINEAVYQNEVKKEEWLSDHYKENADAYFKTIFQAFNECYILSDLEIELFPLIYKVIRPYKYIFLSGLMRSYTYRDYEEVNYRLKWMVKELDRHDLHELVRKI